MARALFRKSFDLSRKKKKYCLLLDTLRKTAEQQQKITASGEYIRSDKKDFILSQLLFMMASSLNYEREVLNLENATTTKYIESVTILLKILDNVIREPQNDKYRTIRLENKIIKEKLLCLNGVREFLEKIGFVEVRHFRIWDLFFPPQNSTDFANIEYYNGT